MKFIEFKQTVFPEMAVGPDSGTKEYYHGTDYNKGKAIAKDGFIKAPEISTKARGYLTPRPGMTYLTNDLNFAIVNATGGITFKRTKEGYLHVSFIREGLDKVAIAIVDADDIKEFDVDEDTVAELLNFAMFKDNEKEDPEKYDLAKRVENHILLDPKLSKRIERTNDRWFGFQVSIAKQFLKKLPHDHYLRQRLYKYANSIAHKGNTKVREVRWFNTKDLEKVKNDLSNFWGITKKI